MIWEKKHIVKETKRWRSSNRSSSWDQRKEEKKEPIKAAIAKVEVQDNSNSKLNWSQSYISSAVSECDSIISYNTWSAIRRWAELLD
mgnify:CR=1 FL=1